MATQAQLLIFWCPTTRDLVGASMFNVKVKSSLKEQAFDPPICTLLYFYFYHCRIRGEHA